VANRIENTKETSAMKKSDFQMTSPMFKDGEDIPDVYAHSHQNFSPAFQWKGLPEGVKELALVCEDPDAPAKKPWIHWIAYQIPSHLTSFKEGLNRNKEALQELGILEGKNSWGNATYEGPEPPEGEGPHRYFFRLYALSRPVALHAGASIEELREAMKNHVLGEATLMGHYETKPDTHRTKTIRDSMERSYNLDSTRQGED